MPVAHTVLCPFCGRVSASTTKCEHCAGSFDPLSRQATTNAMGPWYVRDDERPFQPGCSYEVIRRLVRKGRLTPDTILRGPTTRQFWTFAKRTPTVANLLGICHSCQESVDPSDYMCRACGAVFTPETDRQHLGLGAVHLLPGEAPPDRIARQTGGIPASSTEGSPVAPTDRAASRGPSDEPAPPRASKVDPESTGSTPPPDATAFALTPDSRPIALESTVRSQRLVLLVVVPLLLILLGALVIVVLAPRAGWSLGAIDGWLGRAESDQSPVESSPLGRIEAPLVLDRPDGTGDADERGEAESTETDEAVAEADGGAGRVNTPLSEPDRNQTIPPPSNLADGLGLLAEGSPASIRKAMALFKLEEPTDASSRKALDEARTLAEAMLEAQRFRTLR